ncbi:hypothetical protein [Methylomonas koyamae]|uniref:hypothetical protein n=1 Tax=Methylomonas koyamae TaxID=702114 RepID=UPI00112D1112|nr:hypothetical protein [Methylomonas koyamae]TPQ24222.1 hypothetical protein C2U68_20855 [Methylomonas koyamae]
MLKSLDILLGLSVVMLIASMAVTLISQAILKLLASRGRNLHHGLTDLLEVLDPRLARTDAAAIAGKVLSQQTIGGRFRSWLPPRLRFLSYGEVIHREEFVKSLLELAAAYDAGIKAEFDRVNAELANGAITVNVGLAALENKLREYPAFLKSLEAGRLIQQVKTELGVNKQKRLYQKLKGIIAKHIDLAEKLGQALGNNGVENPTATLKNVRMLALQFEKSNPELAQDVREANALLQEAASEFLAVIHMNFDNLLDRVAVRFSSTARTVSVFSAALLAFGLQLDALVIINRLAMDEQMRSAFVQLAPTFAQDETIKAKVMADAKSQPKTGASSDASAEPVKSAAGIETEKYYLNVLADRGLITWPKDWQAWQDNWQQNASVPGVVLSMFLLSMGGPFWYNVLSKLLQLRSGLARKDDEQKAIRQSSQLAATADALSPTAANPLQGERGDLKALG